MERGKVVLDFRAEKRRVVEEGVGLRGGVLMVLDEEEERESLREGVGEGGRADQRLK